ncbi:aliphatic sulfonates family ABC transporter, periplasmic ligand-binding protein [[Leptolyngbya] sp. PCC 7376]|uniref:ABC transporter substrate-binding protein n=1 Tax=[Leptolyngbya] sp. PCC 7376 TaxID=111781 RepID=UPI00029F1E63|nr:ABC transporter substrate-binding protein [[Leptolyngbya] sp. PCC 7376]AFY40250.1 aliphatic sulfonates family ABC transporter, periplasmic ligand-binding protein [[Leptolyngbya] sp. PCC 7376]
MLKLPNVLLRPALFVAGAAITLAGCQPAPTPVDEESTSTPEETTTETSETTETETVTLGFSAWPGWFPWQIAEEKGLFEENGVDVNLTWFDGYLDSINAFAAGQLDANTQTLNDTISSVAAGSDQVIVLVNDNSTGNDQIIVSEEINAVLDLKGKAIAIEEGTVDHFLLLLALEEEGMGSDDVEIKPLETGAAAAAFVAGQVDAVGAFAPFTTQALEREGSKTLISSADFPGAIPDHLVVSRELIDENPEAVQGLIDTWFATLEFIEENPDEAIEIMAERANVTVEEYKEYDAGTTIFSIEDNLEAFSSTEESMTSLTYAANEINTFLVEAGLVAEAANLDNLFDSSFVEAYAEK